MEYFKILVLEIDHILNSKDLINTVEIYRTIN